MRKTRLFAAVLFTAMLLTCLTGCVSKVNRTGISEVWGKDGNVYIIDFDGKTIKHNDVVYSYEVSGEDSDLSFTIHYPNGATYYSTPTDDSWSDNYDPRFYKAGNALADALQTAYAPRLIKPDPTFVIVGLLCACSGLFSVFAPEAAMELHNLFRIRLYESIVPSEFGIKVTRITGGLAILIGVILFFVNWS